MSERTENVFAWIGCVIVNAAFISLITWGATANWWIGYVTSICYTVILYGLALGLESDGTFSLQRFQSSNDVENIELLNGSGVNESHRPRMLITLLYGLATLSGGVTGSFLPSNLIDCYETFSHCGQFKAIAYLFLSALPITVASVYLWYQRQIPSMGITTFIGISGIAVCAFYVASPKSLDESDFYKWWTLCFGGIWVIFTTNGILSSMEHKAPMWWGLNVGSLSYLLGGNTVLGVYATLTMFSTMWQWLVFNAAILVPLCVLGLATKSSVLLILTAICVLMDAVHICELLTRNLAETFSALTYFLVLGFTGLLTAVLGWLLSRRQQEISSFLCAYLEPYAWPRHTETTATTRNDTYHQVIDENLNGMAVVPAGTEKMFAWIGCIIINAAFISFIGWGVSAHWWIGFVVSIWYTAILFALARELDTDSTVMLRFLQFRSPNDLDDIDRFNESRLNESNRPTMLISLLFGLATLSVGVTGFLLSSNVTDCSTFPYEYPSDCHQSIAIANFFLSALPLTVVTIYLWYQRHVSSMGITTFIGISGIAFCVFSFVSSKSPSGFIKWWMLCFGGIWAILTTNGILSSLEHKAPMRWGLNVGLLAFFIGGFLVLDIFASASIVQWVVFNAFILVPLCVLGLATQSSFPLVLTCVGVLINAVHICDLLTRDLNETLVALTYFVGLGFTGLLIAVLGWLLSRRQHEISIFLCAYLQPYVWPRHRETTVTVDDIIQNSLPTTDEDRPTSNSTDGNVLPDDFELL